MDPQTHVAPDSGEVALYEYAAASSFAGLPGATVESVAAAVLDHFGCAIVGMHLPWTAALLSGLELAGELRTAPAGAQAHVYGRAVPVAATTAALVNGTATHGIDLDDTHLATMTHPGCVVIPAAVAMAEASESDGPAFLAAVVAGYEVMTRIARATGLGFGEKGFHATGQVGPMGAAAACSRLLGGGADEVGGAIGLAASFGGGIKAFSVSGGMVKRLHAGRAAHAGVLAATLQGSGFTGPREAVAGRFGFVPTFSTDTAPDHGALTAGLGEQYAIDEIYLKPYAACGAVHGAVAAAASLSGRPAAEIERVVVGTSRRAVRQNSIPAPDDVMAAQYSTEYSVALALAGAAGDPRRYLDVDTGTDGVVRQLAARVTLEVDESAERSYPDTNEARVDVWATDGSHRAARATVSASTSSGWETARAKFLRITGGLIEPAAQHRVVEAVAGLAHGGSVAACLRALASPP